MSVTPTVTQAQLAGVMTTTSSATRAQVVGGAQTGDGQLTTVVGRRMTANTLVSNLRPLLPRISTLTASLSEGIPCPHTPASLLVRTHSSRMILDPRHPPPSLLPLFKQMTRRNWLTSPLVSLRRTPSQLLLSRPPTTRPSKGQPEVFSKTLPPVEVRSTTFYSGSPKSSSTGRREVVKGTPREKGCGFQTAVPPGMTSLKLPNRCAPTT